MPTVPKAATTGSPAFTPDSFFVAWSDERQKDPVPDNDLRASIIQAFDLKPDDSYVYHAVASVTLQQVQNAVIQGGNRGLHAWYRDGNEVIKALSRKRRVIDMGSGNGYWTYMLRRAGLTVAAVDNMQSLWRTIWVDDTVVEDGIKYLKNNNSGKDDLLLLVYPIVSLDFTKQILAEYAGDTICIAGTQNANGYTAFKDVTVNEYFEQEMKGFQKVVQIPLPSFAGKDEALYVFEKNATTA
ncbi:hypothetical protein ABW20_dc0109527 [Dactylellina cionopaga]|nr:hypothetical protein ABW20_dc0109527 [Dactylellina cionopaga]